MKLIFRGWRREVTRHHHELEPVALRDGQYSVQKGEGVRWYKPGAFYAKISKVALSGDFLLAGQVTDRDVLDLLLSYAKHDQTKFNDLMAQLYSELGKKAA